MPSLSRPHAHARIVSIDSAAALALPGVVAVLTAHDIGRLTTPTSSCRPAR